MAGSDTYHLCFGLGPTVPRDRAVGGETMTTRRRRLEGVIVVVLLAVALGMRVPSFGQPLLEAHPFRQTQTALTARMFHEEGIDLLHPRLPVLGDPGEVPFEFPLFQAVAAVPMAAGVSSDVSLRATCLAFFLLTAILVWGFTRRLAGSTGAVVATAVFLFSPLGMLWSRTAMIEYLATAGALGWAWAGTRWRDRHRTWTAVIAVVGGVVAMLVKPPTAVFWTIPLLAYATPHDSARSVRDWIRIRCQPTFVLIMALPFVAGIAWTRHADAIKAASASTSFLMSTELIDWNFGPLSQRFSTAPWVEIGTRGAELLLGLPFLFLVGVWAPALLLRRNRGFLIALATTAILPIVVFFNLYVVHDYYLAAISPQAAILSGCAAAALFERRHSANGRVAVAVVVVVLVATLPWRASDYWRPMYQATVDPWQVLPYASELAAATRPSDRVLFEGFDWSSTVPYYSHRTGLMLSPHILSERLLDSLPDGPYKTLLVAEYTEVDARVLARWPWISTPSPHVYHLARESAALGRGEAFATNDPNAIPSFETTRPLLDAPLTIACNGMPVSVIAGSHWTWLRFEGNASQSVVLGDGTAGPLPADRVVVVPSAAVGRHDRLQIRCTGGMLLRLISVVDGPAPDGVRLADG